MSSTETQLVNQHIKEYESRLKHIDELYARADQATKHLDDNHQTRVELNDYQKQKSLLEEDLANIKTMELEDWRDEMIEDAGPMAIWDILAQELEGFVERVEKELD